LDNQIAQYEALAQLSSEALSGRPIAEITLDAVKTIDRVLDIRGAAIWLVRKHAVTLAASHGEQQVAEEVVRSRMENGQSSVRDGSALLVIAGPEGPAGVLAVTAPQRLRGDEVHFLTSIANVIGHAIARGQTEEQLQTRAAQQIAIAQFGRFALLGITQELLEHLCELVEAILEVDYSTFLEYDRDSNSFHRGAGRWWIADDASVPAGEETLSGYTSLHGGPTIVTDYASETRFTSHAAFAEQGLASGMAAEVRGERNLYGVLTAQSRTPRQFTDTDARFLQSLANAAAEAMEREAAQRALAESQEQLAKANRVASLGRLAATIAHEFNNVLMGISPFVELLRRGDLAPERRVSALDHMTKAIQRGRRITEEILRFTNQPEPVFESVDLRQWSEAIVQELRALIGQQYTFRVEAPDRTLRARADAGQLHQIVSNLVFNARDAMPEGGRITLSIRSDDAFAHLIVADEGSGMAEETKLHIFEPLFTTKRHGTGLGLAITHQIVQRHGGTIFVESELGKGTSFHILLPLADGGVKTRGHGGPQMAPRSTQLRRVLLVEDDVNVATGIALLLQEENFAVETVSLGAEAIDGIRRTSPDVVVLDVGLPDIEGTQVYEEIAAAYPNLPVIFSTGHGDEKRLEAYLSLGNVAMLLKPYEIDVLIAAINRLTSI
jgi:signal transduction histidine kinase